MLIFGSKSNTGASDKELDFAFPEKVEKSASTALKNAIKKGDSQMVVESLIQLGVARTLINTDSLPSVIRSIEDVETRENDPATKALLNILLSEIYTQAYNRNRDLYDNREAAAPSSDDFRLWNRQQFVKKVASLADKALAKPDYLQSIKIQDYKKVITIFETDLIFYPTLLDFVGSQAIGNLSRFVYSSQNMLSISLLENPLDESLYPGESVYPVGKILSIYKLLIQANVDNPAPYFTQYAAVEEFIAGKLFYPDDNSEEISMGRSEQSDVSPLNRRLLALYDINADNEFSAIFLTKVDFNTPSNPWAKEFYGRLTGYRDRFPNSRFIPDIDNAIKLLTVSNAQITLPASVGLGQTITASVTSVNAREVVVELFDLTSKVAALKQDSYVNNILLTGLKPLETKKLEFADEPPYKASRTIAFQFPKYGVYAVRLTVDGQSDEQNLRLIRCSDLTAGVSRDVRSVTAWVVDGTTGAPVEDATLYFLPWSRRQSPSQLPGQTSADGSLSLKITEYGRVKPMKGDDRYADIASVNSPIRIEDNKSCKVEIFTSLGLYRPGDKVDFSIVAFFESNEGRTLANNLSVALELRDANYSPCDTVRILTDSWGRGEGSFTLPSTGLTGWFTIRVTDYSTGFGQKSFSVSDYKLPDFEVKTTEILPPASLSSPAVVKGRATAYSGFPIADAKITAKLKVMAGYWWRHYESQVFYTVETQSDKNGEFAVEIPASVIASSPAPNGVFVCDMTVTADNGESHDLKAMFNMGKPLQICVSVPSEINLESNFSASVTTADLLGVEKPVELEYEAIKIDGATVSHGVVMPGSIVGIIKELPVGSYTLRFRPVDAAMASPAETAEFVVYSPEATESPVNQHLWMPRQEVRADEARGAEVILGSSADEVNVLMLTSVYPGKIVERKWIKIHKGMQRIPLRLPDGTDRCEVRFISIKDFNAESYIAEVLPHIAPPAIKLIETFRDHTTPGDSETVKIAVDAQNGASPESAVLLDMSNKAIDVLAPNKLAIGNYRLPNITTSFQGFEFSSISSSVYNRCELEEAFQMSEPEFNLYGYSFTQRPHYLGLRAKMARSTRDSSYDEEEADGAVYRLDMASPANAIMAKGSAPDMADMVVEESADAGYEESQVGDNQADNYRPSEIPLAFFEPMLTTDAAGMLEYTYEVPNANTTWMLRGVAYNKDVISASFESEIVASKPVMVSVNAPRFLRSGDRILLPATVMNNSDSTLVLDVALEVLAGTSQRVLASDNQQIILPAGDASALALPLDSIEAEPNLIFRVKASGTVDSDLPGNAGIKYSDGEQTVIPILPSLQDVVESELFYLAPDQPQFTLQLPEIKQDEAAYLNFTENPAWEIVSALPGLRDNKINSSLEAMASLFSAAVAEGIVKSNPEIARVIRKWAEQGDSALISNLEKNSELKSMLLSSTPWVSEALSETQRMQRLVVLFDGKETARVKRDAIAILTKCFIGSGWCWTEKNPQVSQWVTMAILDQLGQLNKLGYMPSDAKLLQMTKYAVDYIDKAEVNDFAKYPKADRWLYLSIRDCFPEYKLSTAASRVVEAQVQRCLADWKTAELPLKAVYALILDKHGYHATARQVLASLREYSTQSPEKGMWWQQLDRYSSLWSYDRIGITALILDAFHDIEPSSPDVDKIRQWLILNKTNNDWGNAIMTTQAVAAILRSGKPLKINPNGTAIHIGATLLEPTNAEYATGAFTENISSLLTEPQLLTIDRQADYPSVGGIVMMRRLPMDSISAVDCGEIAIEKHISVFRDGQWGDSQKFNVGDKVKVDLTLRVEDDLSYVIIQDARAACLEPVEQLPRPLYAEGLCFYRENRDSQTNIFIDFLPRGVYRLTYDLYVAQAGEFSSGAAEIQSQYNPIVVAHSAGSILEIEKLK